MIPSVKKRFLIGLAPLVVVGAFLVIPAAPQALPHVYKNGVIGAEGKKVRTLQWGVFKLTNTTTGSLECHVAFEGFLENPLKGGSATGQVQAFSPYECSNPTCTTAGGLFVELTTEHLPWNVEIIEPSPGVFRHKMGVKGEKGGKGSVEFFYNCEGVIKEHVFGGIAPLALNNGLSIGAAPGEIEFDAASGELGSAVGAFEPAGRFKQQGFPAQELIEAKNP